jgi:hypothetical protein
VIGCPTIKRAALFMTIHIIHKPDWLHIFNLIYFVLHTNLLDRYYLGISKKLMELVVKNLHYYANMENLCNFETEIVDKMEQQELK